MRLLCRRWTRHGSPPCCWCRVWLCWRLDSSTCTALSSAFCPRRRCATRLWLLQTHSLASGKVTRWLQRAFCRGITFAMFDFLSLFPPDSECSAVFHKGGARLILCGKSWEKLEELADDLEKHSDPTKVAWCLNEREGICTCKVCTTHWCGQGEAHV